MRCPRCDVDLLPSHPDASLPDAEALQCPHCEGHWLEQAALKRLEQTVEVKWWEFRHVPPPAIQAELLACPRCEPAPHLLKLVSEQDRKVVMDACAKCHGVWLDGGELKAIRERGVVSALFDAVRYLAKL